VNASILKSEIKSNGIFIRFKIQHTGNDFRDVENDEEARRMAEILKDKFKFIDGYLIPHRNYNLN
jgi:hypothetical protein